MTTDNDSVRALLAEHDRQLTPAEIANITGIEGEGRHRAQANQLKRAGIKHHINARHQVVVFESWVQLAAVGQLVIEMPGTKAASKTPRAELKLDFSALEKA